MTRKSMLPLACAAALATALACSPPALAQGKKMVIAAPGIPPVLASLQLYVAEKEGLFRKYGANVEVRPFETGTAAARAVIAGDIDLSLSPSALIINQISNADVNLVAIYGLINTDFLLATTDPSKTCKDIVGQPVGIDTVGGARSIALRTMLAGGCPGVTINQVQQVALSSNVAPAMLAGRLQFGVLHLDDVAMLEVQGKKVEKLLTVQKTNPNGHYLLYLARRDKLRENRDLYVRLLAGLIDASRVIRDPANADRIAMDGAPTGHAPAIIKATIKPLLELDYWPVADDGLDRTRLENLVGVMKKTGGIQPGKTPVSYQRLVDESVFRDAAAMVK